MGIEEEMRMRDPAGGDFDWDIELIEIAKQYLGEMMQKGSWKPGVSGGDIVVTFHDRRFALGYLCQVITSWGIAIENEFERSSPN